MYGKTEHTGAALRSWMTLAEDHDVYLELDVGFSGVMEKSGTLPSALACRLDEWMQEMIQRCRREGREERWMRLKFVHQGNVLRLECEAAGTLPECKALQDAGAYLETADLGDSFFVAIEAGLPVDQRFERGLRKKGGVKQ